MIKLKSGTLHQRALFVPDSLNEEERSVSVVFATDSPVRMYSEDIGYFYEILSMDAAHIRTERILSGAPLLDNHVLNGTRSQLGIIEDVRFEKNKAIAKVRYSKREDVEPIWQDVKDKILRGISVGYKVYRYQLEIPATETEIAVYRAIDWEPYEISHAPVQADYKSSVRAEQNTHELQVLNLNNTKMEDVDNGIKSQTTQTAAVSEAAVLEARSNGQKSERERGLLIKTAVRAANLSDSFGEKHIEEGTEINQFRALVIEELAKTVSTQNIAGRAAITVDETDKMRTGMEEALLHRADPANKIAEGNEFKGMSLVRMGEAIITGSGGSVKGLSPRQIAETSLNLRAGGYHSTSDFPLVLGNTVNRTLRKEYARLPQTFKPFTTASTVPNFKLKTVVQLGDISSGLDRVVGGGEYKYGTMTEGGESYSVLKYGKIIAITWEAIINDDLNAFSRIPKNIALKTSQLESDIVWGIITANAALSDGVALFHATHGNLAATGTAITIASLSAARTAMRKQKSLGGDFLNLTPEYLVVGPDKELEAFQFTSSMYTPTANNGINPDFNKNLKVIVEPRLTGNQWYLIADPGMIDTIEYAYLEGENGLFTEQRQGFDVDGLEIKARLVFGAKAIDYRGFYKNNGA